MTAALLTRLLRPEPLSDPEVRDVLDALVDPEATDAQRAGLLVALRGRPETVTELAGFASAMRARALPFEVEGQGAAIDLCGSGGAPAPTFNVSTLSAFVVAAAGLPVIKHGNRSARGPCGSSDLLEALGLPVTRSREFPRESFRRHRLAFLHAPLFHPATRAVVGVRRELGVPTIFNRLGPLVNPAHVPFQLVGAPDAATAERFAGVLGALGLRRALSMSAAEGADEFSPSGVSEVALWDGRAVRRRRVKGPDYLPDEDRAGPWGALPPRAAAAEAERVLAGGSGATRGSVLLTSGAALWLAGRASNLREAIRVATEALDGGAAEGLLEDLRRLSEARPWGKGE